jgi:hypothetical protein
MLKQFRLLLTFYIGFAAPSIIIIYSTYLKFDFGICMLMRMLWCEIS